MEANAVLLVSYLVLMLGVIWWVSRGNGLSDFLIAGRKNSGLVMGSGIIIGWVDILWFSFYSTLAYVYGWWVLPLVLLPILLGFFWLRWQAAFIKQHSTEARMITMADWFTHHFDRLSGLVLSAGIVLAMVGWLAAIMVSMGLIAHETYGFDYFTTILILSLFTMAMALKGGFGSLTRFDMVQMVVLVCLGVGVVTFWPTHDLASSFSKMGQMQAPGFMEALGIFVTFFSAVIAAADVWQRVHAVRSTEQLRLGAGWAAFWAVPALGLAFWFGITALANTAITDPNLVFAGQLELLKGTVLESAVLLMLLVAVLSTLNVAVYAAASCLAKNLMPATTEEALRVRIRWLIPTVVAIAMVTSMLSQNVLAIGLALLSSAACFAPVLLLQSMKPSWLPQRGIGKVLALSFGSFLILTFTLPGAWQMLLPPAITLVLCPLVALCTKGKKAVKPKSKKRT